MWYEYLMERHGWETMLFEHGFIVYEINGENCFIQEIYVKPEARRNSVGTHMADQVEEIAKERGCKKIWGTVVLGTYGANEAMMAHLNWGLKLHSINGNCILTVKEL